MAIIDALKDWRQFLEGLSEPFEIWSDHQNLEFWRTAQHLTRRQARWALYLAEYDFRLVHKPGKTQLQADPMSRISAHEVTNAEDNKDRIVLKPEQFRAISATAFADLEASDLEKQIRS